MLITATIVFVLDVVFDLFNEKGINRLKSNIKNRIVVENTVKTNTEQNNVSGEAESQENSLTEIGG